MAKNQIDTCNWGECYFSTLFDNRDQCPYFHRLHWLTQDGGQAYHTDDCSAKKTMMMVQELFTRIIGVQKASEQERNAAHALVSELYNIVAIIQENPSASVQILISKDRLLENDNG
jgi:hypothetical protein